MLIEVKIPAVGESITSGVVSAWHKKSVDFVNEDEQLFTLETDKLSTEIVAEKAGTVEAKVTEGQEVKIREVVGTLDDSKQPAAQKKEVTPKKAPEEKKKGAESSKKLTEKKEPVAVDRGEPESTTPATTLSPAVRRIVEEEKVELEKIRGTGEGGRLTKADVLAAVEERGEAKPVGERAKVPRGAAPSPTAIEPSTDGRFVRKKMSPLRRKIAQQLVTAQHTAAILTTFNECDMSAVQELRRSKQEEFTKK